MRFIKPMMAIAAALTLFTQPLQAQTTRSALTIVNNAEFKACGNGCITGPMVNSFNAQMLASTGFLADNNIWTGSNTFNGPISFATLGLTGPTAPASATGAIYYGTLPYTDTGIFASFTNSINGYAQHIVSNTSAGTAASADYIVSNNLGTATSYYGDFGINGSNFTGTGSFSLPNATFLTATSGDLAIGTTTANAVHFSANSAATDAFSINSSNAPVFPGLTGYMYGNGSGAVTASTTIPSSVLSGSINAGSSPSIYGTASAFSNPWGFSPAWVYGGNYSALYDTSSASTGLQAATQVQRSYTQTGTLALDYAGATGASVPTFYVESKTSGGSNLQVNSIVGYCLNGGSQDCIGSSGRANRLSSALPSTGQQEVTGVWGSAYNNSSNAGFSAGLESAIYNTVTGTVASDQISNAATNGSVVSLHSSSYSTGSPANAVAVFDSNYASGFYGAWNGLILDSSVFNQNGSGTGVTGTVGVNGGSWGSSFYPYTGIKLGNATQHIQCNYGPCVVNSASGVLAIYGNGNAASAPTTAAGMALYSNTSQNSYIDFYSGVTHGGNIFYSPSLSAEVVNSLGTNTQINPNGGGVLVNGLTQLKAGVYSNVTYIGTTATLTTASFGNLIELTGGPYTITLPTPNGFAGAKLNFWVNTTSTITLSTPSGSFFGSSGSAASTLVLSGLSNYRLVLESDGFNWFTTLTPFTSTSGAITAPGVATTTLSASSTVSGTGFSTYLASPPAIGGTAPSTVKATSYALTNVVASSTAPTISSGFGTAASVTANNGTAAFRINVGTGGTATSGVIGLPAATTGWNCFADDVTTTSAAVFRTKQTASTTTTVTLTQYSDVAVATAWVASDVLAVSCFAY